MRKVRVLDSWALLAYLEGESSGKKVREVFKEASSGGDLLISVVNWGEVLYVIEARYGTQKRDEIERLMDQMNLEIVEADKGITRRAAHIKATSRLPYGDSFAAALALDRKAELVTGDRDFHLIEHHLRIFWI